MRVTPVSSSVALVIGICQYAWLNNCGNDETDENKLAQLTELVKNTNKLAEKLRDRCGFKVTQLPKANNQLPNIMMPVSLEELDMAIGKLLCGKQPPKKVLLLFVGHGLTKHKLLGEKLFSEGFLADSYADNKTNYGFSLKTLHEYLRESEVEQFLVFLESCYSGKFLNEYDLSCLSGKQYLFVTSTQADNEASAEGHLIKALLHESLWNNKGKITGETLCQHLSEVGKGSNFIIAKSKESNITFAESTEGDKGSEPTVDSQTESEKQKLSETTLQKVELDNVNTTLYKKIPPSNEFLPSKEEVLRFIAREDKGEGVKHS